MDFDFDSLEWWRTPDYDPDTSLFGAAFIVYYMALPNREHALVRVGSKFMDGNVNQDIPPGFDSCKLTELVRTDEMPDEFIEAGRILCARICDKDAEVPRGI